MSLYDLNNMDEGITPLFCIKSEEYFQNGEIYYGLLYRVTLIKKYSKTERSDLNSMIIGPVLNYHPSLDFLYFWTGNLFNDVKSLKTVYTRRKGPIMI